MKKLGLVFGLLSVAGEASAAGSLLYLEGQGIAGYSNREHKAIYHSADKHDAMQKNSVGVDFLHKFSGDAGDWGRAAVQLRLAYDDEDKDVKPQLYNAYITVKSEYGDVWAGHNRMAFGLASYWDTHSDLIGDLTMQGVGFDRDWGVGYGYDYDKGDVAVSVTTGSGMALRDYGNWLAAARASYGVLNYDNHTTGLSFMAGKVLDVMGYKVMDRMPKDTWLIGWDAAYNVNNFEHKAEIDVGRYNHRQAFAALYRLSVKLDSDEQWKYDFQTTYLTREDKEDWTVSNALSYQITSSVKVAVMHTYRHQNSESRCVGQIYFYNLV